MKNDAIDCIDQSRPPMNSPRSASAALRSTTDELIRQDCRWDAFRASGPGGQKRNKTSSAIRVTHIPTGITAIANESRSQAANKKSALQRLRHRMTIDLREPIDPTSFSVPQWFESLRATAKLKVPPRDPLYLPVAGLVLDVLAACHWSVSQTAILLGLSTGNLVRFLQNDQKLMAHVNERRGAEGLKHLGLD